ncbi:cyclase family protein [Flavicella sp.]|uniref:cyclase family protein n=1 Tax=Flavicella sp. TaxID=2957742 RepID=UPI00260336A6|nr:cyclase family protein [Flavicella sp.]MDG1805836.1 cyclase family protein [Flavicella sp.]
MINKPGGKTIDLTRKISNGDPGVQIESAKTIRKDGWNATTLNLYSHSGTHMDAPMHFAVNDKTIDQIPVDRFISNAWLIDLSGIQAGGLINIEDLGDALGLIMAGDSLLFRTGWSFKFGTKAYRDELPRISKELAVWCGAKGINLIGVEPPSVADVNAIDEVTEIHEILMKNDIIIVEGLINLDKIINNQVTLIAMPLKVANGDGAPARVIAIEE